MSLSNLLTPNDINVYTNNLHVEGTLYYSGLTGIVSGACIYTNGSSSTSYSSTYIIPTNTTSLSSSSTSDWTMPSNFKLLYGGISGYKVLITASGSSFAVSSGVLYQIRKNGTTILTSSVQGVSPISGTNPGSGSFCCQAIDTVNNGDYYEFVGTGLIGIGSSSINTFSFTISII